MTQATAIVLDRYGEPGVMQISTVDVPDPGAGQLLIRQTAVGVNYHDIYIRSGLYTSLKLPAIPGVEGVGVIEAIGPGVTGWAVGERVGYVDAGYGAYASRRLLPADRALRLPGALEDAEAAGSLLRALTVCVLVRRVHVLKAGETVLVHAAAGGTGQLLCRWARHLGATVIGTVGSAAKVATAEAAGAHHVVRYREEDFVARVMEVTGGTGASAAYDSVGEDTFLGSMKCLDVFGTLVSYGQASGPVSPFPVSLLAEKSTSVVRPIVFHYLRDPAAARLLAEEVMMAFASGAIRPSPVITLPLARADEAHRMLQARESRGAIVLIP